MGQLFLWTQKIGDDQQEEFLARFGFDIPGALVELHENLPEEFLQFFRIHSIRQVIAEDSRPAMLMPGLIPFAEEGDGDLYCMYLPWKSADGNVPIGIWLNETNHFLPITNRMDVFLLWWLIKETHDAVTGEDWTEVVKMLELFQQSCGLDHIDLLSDPPRSALEWHTIMLQMDPQAPFSLTYVALSQFALQGFDLSLEMLTDAERSVPNFGAASLWQARIHAMRGHVQKAHQAYWRHLRTPIFANGYHYWWHAGDLQVPESSEIEAIRFFEEAEIRPPRGILEHPKFRFLKENDPTDHRKRLRLVKELERIGDFEGALVEMENTFFLKSWDADIAQELLESLLCVYPEHNRIREAEQCRRTLRRLRGESPAV